MTHSLSRAQTPLLDLLDPLTHSDSIYSEAINYSVLGVDISKNDQRICKWHSDEYLQRETKIFDLSASRAISSMQLHLLHSTPTNTPEGDKFFRSFRHAPSGANKIKLIESFWSAVCISRASLLCLKKEDMSPLEAFGSLADNSAIEKVCLCSSY